MATKVAPIIDEKYLKSNVHQLVWPRIILLVVLAYEAAGSVIGGALLVAAPDGRLLDMPIEILHGSFDDFFVPGLLLLALGIITTAAFVTVLRKMDADWFVAGLALGGLLVWFVVEIIILQELHWLHAIWGLPVLLGWIMCIPLISFRQDTGNMQQILLSFGIRSSLYYFAINLIVPGYYEGYNMASFTVSELSAIDAPTRILWVLLSILYPLMFAAFGWGVIQSGNGNRALSIAGRLILLYCVLNLFWPPMHQRAVLAAGEGTLTDILHIFWAVMTIVFMMVMMGYGAAALGKGFRLFTIATFVVFVVFGVLIGVESPGIKANLPTPHIGISERITIAAFMVWVIVFAAALRKKQKMSVAT